MRVKSYDIVQNVVAFSTMRHEGYSKGTYAKFNINKYCGDILADIELNRKALCDFLGIVSERIITPHQTHQTVTRVIDDSFFHKTEGEKESYLDGVDALITSVPNICIGVSTADCIPIIIYDPEHHAAAVIHAGWRGTVKRIAETAIETMKEHFHTQPEVCKAVIGPGISLQNFEVGDEVYEEFHKEGFPMQLIAKRFAKWHIDLWEANRISLSSKGLQNENIQTCGICTYDNTDSFFSARKLGIKSGRILTAVMLK